MERPAAAAIPATPGVYLYKDEGGRILYVGKARNLRKRVLSYFRPSESLTPKTVALIGHARSLETLVTTTEKEALLLEASLIKKHRPRYNIVLRDDKQYVLFRLSSREPFPRLEITRAMRKRDGARYFGPFTSSLAARETWKSIHRIFPLRRCPDRVMRNRVKPCLYYHIGLCLAPCSGQISEEDYADIVLRVGLLLAGKSRELTDMLQAAMFQASERLDFEKAAAFRDQIRAVEATIERQAVVLPHHEDLDVIGLTTLNDGLGLGLIFIRQGRMLDRATFFWPGLGLAEAGELIQSFLTQFYKPDSAIAPRIVIPWLPGSAGSAGSLETPESADAPEAPESANAPETANAPESPEAPEATADDAKRPIAGGHADDTSACLAWDPDEAVRDLAALEASLSEMRGAPVHISAPRNADEHRLVDMAKSNAREAARHRVDIPLSERLALVFHCAEPVSRIECVDVSHTGGAATKVGLVVYTEGKARKDEYRVWNIPDADGDDYAALALWARRRFEHGGPWPDLLLVDGGKGQLAVVGKVFREAFAAGQPACSPPFLLAGIAKARDEAGRADRRAGNVADRVFVPGRSNPLSLREGSAELLFLQAVRDAAHDFSLGRHRQARARLAFSGELQRLNGVGPHTAKLLWEHFDSVEEMRQATQEQLAALPGIGKKKAEKIHASLQSL